MEGATWEKRAAKHTAASGQVWGGEATEQGDAHTQLTTSIPFNKMWKVV